MNEDRLLYLIRDKTPEEKLLDIIKKTEVKKDSTIPSELVKKPKVVKIKKTKTKKTNIPALAGILSFIILTPIIILTILPQGRSRQSYNKPDLINTILNNYAFTGIILGGNPQVIIEDKRHSNIYYLKEGEFLGEIKILKIKRGLVTLKYQGKILEIQI